MERGDLLAVLTLLQFQHPQYTRLLEEIKHIHPGSLGLSFGMTISGDIETLLKAYLPAEVGFLEISPRVETGSGVRTRMTATDPEYPISGLSLGFYRIIVESSSAIDESVLFAKAQAHQSSPALCLHRSVQILNMSPTTKHSHRQSHSITSLLSLFRHKRSRSN